MSIDSLLVENSGIHLDIGCGENKQPGTVGMDIRPLPGVDIVHDINAHPWPLPDECVKIAYARHLVEHIPPMAIIDGVTRFLFIEFIDEVWRIMKPGGQFAILTPHGYSSGYIQDPTHCNPCNEATWGYFSPGHPSLLYNIYRPKPWRVAHLTWDYTTNIEVLLEKISDVRDT